MNEELVRRIVRLEQQLNGLDRPEKALLLAAPFLGLPALRGLWVSSVASGGNWHDLSGHGNHLVYRGNPAFSLDAGATFGYWALDGTGDYFDITDAASGNDFDILGTEAYIGTPGLTVLGWFYSTTIATTQGLATKWLGAGNQRSYYLQLAASQVGGGMSNAGAAIDASASSGTALSSNTWFFAGLRFEPSTALTVFQNEVSAQDVAGVPASIFNSTADFVAGGFSGGLTLLTGRVGPVAVYAAALDDAMVSMVFQHTRGFFGV